jgi:hypothetical protein
MSLVLVAPERFEAKFVRGAPDECWEWQGARSRGYGWFRVGDGAQPTGAHRIAYELYVGPIPDGLYIDHLCRNRGCVNPAHMEPVPNRVNILRGEGITAEQARQTHCKRDHEFTAENTYRIPSTGSRVCRTCKRVADAERCRR